MNAIHDAIDWCLALKMPRIPVWLFVCLPGFFLFCGCTMGEIVAKNRFQKAAVKVGVAEWRVVDGRFEFKWRKP